MLLRALTCPAATQLFVCYQNTTRAEEVVVPLWRFFNAS